MDKTEKTVRTAVMELQASRERQERRDIMERLVVRVLLALPEYRDQVDLLDLLERVVTMPAEEVQFFTTFLRPVLQQIYHRSIEDRAIITHLVRKGDNNG